jgi:hypothetical protein
MCCSSVKQILTACINTDLCTNTNCPQNIYINWWMVSELLVKAQNQTCNKISSAINHATNKQTNKQTNNDFNTIHQPTKYAYLTHQHFICWWGDCNMGRKERKSFPRFCTLQTTTYNTWNYDIVSKTLRLLDHSSDHINFEDSKLFMQRYIHKQLYVHKQCQCKISHNKSHWSLFQWMKLK